MTQNHCIAFGCWQKHAISEIDYITKPIPDPSRKHKFKSCESDSGQQLGGWFVPGSTQSFSA
jgi:hypothetical protein